MTAPAAAPPRPPVVPDRRLRWLVPAALVASAVLALVVALVVGGGEYQPSVPGLPDAGGVVGWGLPLVRLLAVGAAVMTVGWLLSAAVLDPQGRKGALSKEGRADVVRAAGAALVWCVSSVVLMALTLADVLGLPLSEALASRVVSTYAWDVPQVRALMAAALLAAVVAVVAVFASSTGTAATLLVVALAGLAVPTLTGHAGGLGDHALALTAGVTHVLTSAVWVGGLVALVLYAVRRGTGLRDAATSFGQVALVAVVLLAASGVANAYTRMTSPAELVTTDYGWLVLAKVLLLVGLVLLAARVRRVLVPRLSGPGGAAAFVKVVMLEVVLMALAVGIGVALARTPSPRVATEFPTYAESLLGFSFPPEPTVAGVMLGWRPDALMLSACLVAAAMYVAGVLRLRSRGDAWPVGRTISWLLGVGFVLWATNAGIAAYSQVAFSLHMLQHMSLAMMAPILLVLGAPTTLALRAIKPAPHGRRGPREWLVWFLHSPYARFITHPIFVLIVYTIGLYGLYYTTFFGTLMGAHAGHVFMQVHFIVAGYLFYWVVIGIDPTPRQVPYWGRMLLLLLSLVIHSFFALPMLMAGTAMAQEWYGLVQPPWLTDQLADTRLAGGIAWGFGEIPTLIVIIALSVQWSRSDAREAKRHDRKADRDGDAELKAYNAQLARMNARAEKDADVTRPE